MDNIIGIFSEEFWYIAPILVTLTTGITGVINQSFTIKKAWVKQLISWIVGSIMAILAWVLNLITFGDPVWLGVISLCGVVGLSSNGFYDIEFIRNWINTWFVKTN